MICDAYRADYNGVCLVCERLEGKKKAKDSIIMAKRHSAFGDTSVNACGGIDVGRIQAFIHHRVPGTGDIALIVSVRWFGIPLPPHDMNKEIN